MTLSIITFILSFIILATFLSWKVSLARAGKISSIFNPYESKKIFSLPKINVSEIQKIAFILFKKYGLLVAINASKILLVSMHYGQKKFKEKYPKLYSIFEEQRNEDGTKHHSVFLNAITEYKLNMKHFKKRLKEEIITKE